MHQWLHLRFAGPLISFGGVAIDQVGPTRDFPSASAITGLLANALGWHWSDRDQHQSLQDRLWYGAALKSRGKIITDMQNAKLEKSDKAWTTTGVPEGRDGATYDSPHRRQRDYLADHDCRVVLMLGNESDAPDLEAINAALTHPARPLYLGRKPCAPVGPILMGDIQAETARAALLALELDWQGEGKAIWPELDDLPSGARIIDWPDLRNWHTGLHAGTRQVVEGALS